MRRAFAFLSALLIVGTLLAGCGSAGTGSACRNLGADSMGIYNIEKRHRHGTVNSSVLEARLSPSERQARDDLQLKAREAYAACGREARLTTTIRNSPPPP